MIRVKHRGQQLTPQELEELANNYILTNHAQEMIHKRHSDLNVKELILHPMLAYFNTDGSVNIALNEFEYLVVATDRFPYHIITFKEKSHNSINIYEKWEMAKNGFIRRVNR